MFADIAFLLYVGHLIADYPLNAAKAVSTTSSVSVPRLGAGLGGPRSLDAGVAFSGSRHFASQFPLAGDQR
ncbi:hypothetical protein [Streptomyces sp. NPDC057682]|uniref:hypothetical protein n=1 Tax=Streptomyces sp. NPDC057682 TaxID=3346210 RepID=UPI00369EC608